MKAGSFIEIYFEGYIEETGELFDKSTSPGNRNAVIVVTGEQFLLPALDEELKNIKPGEDRTVILPPEKAFGERNAALIKTLPQKAFQRNQVNPIPGTWIEIGDTRGKIISASAGRIRVDFNHPLSGKTLRYNLKVIREVTKTDEQAKALIFQLLGAGAEVKVEGKKATISAPKLPEDIKNAVNKTMKKYLSVIEEIAYVVRKEGRQESLKR